MFMHVYNSKLSAIVFAFISVFFLASISFATPAVTSLSDETPSDEQSVTITGTGFGTKSTAAPTQWLKSNIEAGTNGVDFSASGFSNFKGGTPSQNPKYTTTAKYSGAKSIWMDYYDKQYGCGIMYNFGSTQAEMFVSAWVYHDRGDTCARYQFKLPRVKEDSDYPVNDSENCIINDNWSNENNDIQVYWDTASTKNYVVGDWPGGMLSSLEGNWRRIEMYWKRNSTNNASDGVITQEVIGVGSFNHTDVLTHKQGGNWQFMNIGWYYGSTYENFVDSTPCSQIRDSNIYWDDIYVDNSRARVILANYSTWAARTNSGSKSELQIPSAWSSTSITATINTGGTFASGATAYVYVVDSDGLVNSSGHAVTIGTGGGNQSPEISITTPATCPSTTESTPYSVQGTATDSDGTVASVHWYNDTDSTDGACTADDGSFNSGSETYTCSSIGMQSGDNSLRVVVTDNGSYTGQDSCITSYSPGGDFTNPVVAITDPATTPYNSSTRVITISGTASDDVGLRVATPISVSCPSCDSVGSVTGSTSWSVPITLSVAGGLGSDTLDGAGAFDSATGWTAGTGISIAGGVCTNDGSSSNAGLQRFSNTTIGKNYRLTYDVTSYTSGTLYISQYGFGGQTVQINGSEGTHTVDIPCTVDADLRFAGAYWSGTLDNVTVQEIGTSNAVTVTAYDTSDNSSNAQVDINYLGGSSSKRVNIGADINIGNNIRLEF